MRETRRRKRTRDPLASRAAVGGVLEGLRRRLGAKAPAAARDLAGLVRAAERAEREPDRQAGRGRPPRWEAPELRRALDALRRELSDQGLARIGARTFAGHYLSILAFPPDVAEALESGRVNLFEAEQLARLTGRRLGLKASAARCMRSRVLAAHVDASESGARLRARVADLLASRDMPEVRRVVDELSVADASARLERELDAIRRRQRREDRGTNPEPGPKVSAPSPDHLFYEQLRAVAFALDAIRPGDLVPEDLERVLDLSDALVLAIQSIRRRGGRRARLGTLSSR